MQKWRLVRWMSDMAGKKRRAVPSTAPPPELTHTLQSGVCPIVLRGATGAGGIGAVCRKKRSCALSYNAAAMANDGETAAPRKVMGHTL